LSARESLDGALNTKLNTNPNPKPNLKPIFEVKRFYRKLLRMGSRELIAHPNLTHKTLNNPFGHFRDEGGFKKASNSTQRAAFWSVF